MAVYKRGSVWWMSFQHKGEHVQRTTKCRSKRDAETVERAFRTQLAKNEVGLSERPEAPAFTNAISEFLNWVRVEHRSKPNTIRSYENTSRALVEFFAEIKVDEIEPRHIEAFKKFRCTQKTKPRSAKVMKLVSGVTISRKNGVHGKP